MSMIFNITIYIILVFGIIITTIAFMEESLKKNERYIRARCDGTRVVLRLNVEGMNEKEKILIADVIEKGKYESIYDIVDDFLLES